MYFVFFLGGFPAPGLAILSLAVLFSPSLISFPYCERDQRELPLHVLFAASMSEQLFTHAFPPRAASLPRPPRPFHPQDRSDNALAL